MSLATILAALGAMAVNFGWQKADDGYEYLVQLEPETVQLLSEGVDVPIDSHVPASVQPIRKVRIVVGRAELPRENLDEVDESQKDERVERTTFFRPGETTPASDGRYLAQPAAPTQSSAIDRIVQPIREVDNFVERGFEAGVDGLEKTGNAIRGTVDNATNTVQDQFRRTKETLVGSSPESTYRGVSPTGTAPSGATAAPAGAGALPTVASTQDWPNFTAAPAPASGDTGSIPNLPPPPLSGSETPTVTTNNPNFGPSGWDNRETAPTTSSDNGGRMVPIEDTGTTSPEAQAWQPNAWPPVKAHPASNADWIKNSQPIHASVPSPAPAQPETKVVAEKPTSENLSESSDGKSVGSWTIAVAMIIGSMGGNIFQFFSYLDIRNKYRAALRRTSRSFSRPAAGA